MNRKVNHELQSQLGVLVSVGLHEGHGSWEAERTEAM